jgi:thioredoxin-like negative regulator of GroEL
MIHQVTLENFEAFVDSHPWAILKFSATWCQPCRVFDPTFQGMAANQQQVAFGSVDVDQASDLATAFQVRSVPTVIFFRNAEIYLEQAGVPGPEVFQRFFEEATSQI